MRRVSSASDVAALEDIAPLLQQRRSCFVPNPGNAGDALIALGTFHFFDALRIPFPPIVSAAEKEMINSFEVVIYSGGGNLIPLYNEALDLLRYVVELEKEVIILPHTTYGYESELKSMAPFLKLFCRDRTSYTSLLDAGMPIKSLNLAHDMAFRINPAFVDQYKRKARLPTGYCMRTDGESKDPEGAFFPANRDISLSWNGHLWGDRALVEAVVGSLIAYIGQFDTVVTDRLHIAILAALLGRHARLMPNSYYKNQAVYDFSIRDRFPSVIFHP